MERLFRFALIVMILVALVSCGVFFTPIEGRWNIADPKNELLTFTPIIDGYVHYNATPVWEDLMELIAWPDSKIIVLCFDTADFPDVVAASYLRLTVKMKPSPDAAELSIYRIISSWRTSEISYDFVNNNPGVFFDDSVVTRFTVPSTVYTGDHIQIPVTEVFSGDKEKLSNGIIIYSSIEVSFESTETGPAPLLLVEPE